MYKRNTKNQKFLACAVALATSFTAVPGFGLAATEDEMAAAGAPAVTESAAGSTAATETAGAGTDNQDTASMMQNS